MEEYKWIYVTGMVLITHKFYMTYIRSYSSSKCRKDLLPLLQKPVQYLAGDALLSELLNLSGIQQAINTKALFRLLRQAY